MHSHSKITQKNKVNCIFHKSCVGLISVIVAHFKLQKRVKSRGRPRGKGSSVSASFLLASGHVHGGIHGNKWVYKGNNGYLVNKALSAARISEDNARG